MSLIRYEPYNLLDRFQKELNRLTNWDGETGGDDVSNVVTSAWRPAVDIKEEKDRFVILADLPGVDPKDIEITAEKQPNDRLAKLGQNLADLAGEP